LKEAPRVKGAPTNAAKLSRLRVNGVSNYGTKVLLSF
jgi:hypothetical protein